VLLYQQKLQNHPNTKHQQDNCQSKEAKKRKKKKQKNTIQKFKKNIWQKKKSKTPKLS